MLPSPINLEQVLLLCEQHNLDLASHRCKHLRHVLCVSRVLPDLVNLWTVAQKDDSAEGRAHLPELLRNLCLKHEHTLLQVQDEMGDLCFDKHEQPPLISCMAFALLCLLQAS